MSTAATKRADAPDSSAKQRLLSLEHIVAVLEQQAGRDKAVRVAAFALTLCAGVRSSATTPEPSSGGGGERFRALAKQLSSSRLVSRLFGLPSLLAACRRIGGELRRSTDSVDALLQSATTLLYSVNGFVELIAWLVDAGFLRRWFFAPTLFKHSLRLWVLALAIGIARTIRQMLQLEHQRRQQKFQTDDCVCGERGASSTAASSLLYAPRAERRDASGAEHRRRMNELSLSLFALGFDFVSAVNALPRGVLWAGRLAPNTAATLHLFASLIGLYKCFQQQHQKLHRT